MGLLLQPLTAALAQTAPAPFAFSATTPTYRLNAWDAGAAAGTYPPNVVFHRFSNAAPTAQETAAGDWLCPYNLTSRPRILGKDSLGFSFVNTSSAQYDDCAGGANTLSTFVGEAVLGLNTTNVTAAQVTWTGRMWGGQVFQPGQQERVYAIALQARPDQSAAFTDVPGAVFFAVDATGTTYRPQGDAQTFTAPLPAAVLGQPAAEVRWIYYNASGATGQRPELGVDNIRVDATLTPTGLPTALAPSAALRVWPVPANRGTTITVELRLPQPLSAPVELMSLTGQRVAILQTAGLPAGEHQLRLPVELPAGVYRLRTGAIGVPVVISE
jgi:hypothetical protein